MNHGTMWTMSTKSCCARCAVTLRTAMMAFSRWALEVNIADCGVIEWSQNGERVDVEARPPCVLRDLDYHHVTRSRSVVIKNRGYRSLSRLFNSFLLTSPVPDLTTTKMGNVYFLGLFGTTAIQDGGVGRTYFAGIIGLLCAQDNLNVSTVYSV
jgi:hypothetical protein